MPEELPYEPEVNDYVIWERESWSGTFIDFNTPARYITIETGVRDKHTEQLDGCSLHKKVHTLLLCYEHQWKELRYVKRRESPHIQHYSQYDERAGNWSESN